MDDKNLNEDYQITTRVVMRTLINKIIIELPTTTTNMSYHRRSSQKLLESSNVQAPSSMEAVENGMIN